jgi:hypothetical protein
MSPYTLTIRVSPKQTQLLLTCGSDELLRAALPPPSQVRHESAAPSLLQGIASWLDQPLRVVLSAAGSQLCFCLGLTDELGCGHHTVFYRVEAVDHAVRRRNGRRLRGRVGNFRQLHLLRRQLAEGGAA